MGRVGRKKQHKGDKPLKEKYRTRRKTKDLDQIHEDMIPKNAEKLLNAEVDYDLPGSGQFYCLHCAKHFITNDALKSHFKSKPHKRRPHLLALRDIDVQVLMKALETEPYTQAEAERAAGMGSYVPPAKVKVTQRDIKEDMDQSDSNT